MKIKFFIKILMQTLISALFLYSFTSFVSHADQQIEQNFEAEKAEMTQKIDDHIAQLQEHKTCVSSAKDKSALKECRNKMKEYRLGQREEHLERRKERIEKRKQRLSERRKSKSMGD